MLLNVVMNPYERGTRLGRVTPVSLRMKAYVEPLEQQIVRQHASEGVHTCWKLQHAESIDLICHVCKILDGPHMEILCNELEHGLASA